VLYIVRVVVLSVAVLFSIIVLGLAGDLTSTTEKYFNVALDYASLGIASAVISMVTLPVLLVVDMLRTGAFTSMIVFELPCLFVLWVLWLTTAALAAQANQAIGSDCGLLYVYFVTGCHETQAIEGFAFLIWIMLIAYSVVVLVTAIIGSGRGLKTWTNSVRLANFLGPREGAVPVVGAQPDYAQSATAPPPSMQQHQYPPSGTSTQGFSVSPVPPVSPYYDTQASHSSPVAPQGSVQGAAYV